MTARQLEQMIIAICPWNKWDLDQRTRDLRNAQIIPIGGRGKFTPEIGPKIAAAILLSLASERPGNAAESVNSYGALLSSEGLTLLEVVTDHLRSVQGAQGVKSTTLCRSRLEASIDYLDGSRRTFGGQQQGLARVDLTLSGTLLVTIATEKTPITAIKVAVKETGGSYDRMQTDQRIERDPQNDSRRVERRVFPAESCPGWILNMQRAHP